MTAAEIAKQMEGRLFATVPEVAEILGYDERTIRRGIRSGQIPATQVGATHRVPTAWILAQALIGSAACPAAPLDAGPVGPAVEAWIKAERDKYQDNSNSWHVLDALLAEYRVIFAEAEELEAP